MRCCPTMQPLSAVSPRMNIHYSGELQLLEGIDFEASGSISPADASIVEKKNPEATHLQQPYGIPIFGKGNYPSAIAKLHQRILCD